MRNAFLNINRCINCLGIVILQVIILTFISCYDNFDDSITKENKTTDDNSLPVVSFATPFSNTQNEGATLHNIEIVLSKPSESLITITVEDLHTGSATAGIDYNYTGWSSPELITFNPGETLRTISIIPVQDVSIEGSETINFALSTPINAVLGSASHVMTITDDDGWIKLNDIAVAPRAGMAVTLYGDWLYVYGGETYSGLVLNDFWRYNLTTGEYQSLTGNSSGTRAYATLTELNGALYLFGGEIDNAGTLYNDKLNGIYYYNTSSALWSSFDGSDTTGTFPEGRACHVAVSYYDSSGPDKRLYLHGGADGDNILHMIDIVLYDWQTPQYKISLTRSEHSAVYYNNNIYFFGGYDSGKYYNDLWKFDITTSGFSEVITIGVAIIPVRSGINMIEHNGSLYVFGGQNGTACFDDLWKYSISTNIWTKISTAPIKRCFYSAVKYNNSLIIFGGYYLNNTGQRIYSSELWQYNLD